MALSWNEIKDRAVTFSKEWEDTTNEEAEAKSFIEAFFNIFGVTRKRVGTFEHRVKKLNEGDGYIDLLWKGVILIEMKSKGKNLDKAFIQAKEYIHGLKEHELPKYILVSDFENFRLFDTEEQITLEFKLKELVKFVQHFGFIAGYQKRIYKEQDPVNIKAAGLMGRLHDRLEEIGYEGHPLEVYLVRILFCLFAEDTTIFEKQQFQNYIEDRTNEDGSDLASKLQELFQTLNTPNDKRFKNLDEQLNAFPYVNGKLFEEVLPSASFDTAMRKSLLDCCYIDWSKISPAIFGSMFQSVMNPKERRNLGAHYTSEKNIMKLIKPLFLDELWAEFESVKNNRNKLIEFHRKISQLKFLDPACGCGNFLVITYRELRLLEIDILRILNKSGQGVLDVREIIWLDVDMMYGIEYEEFPARIAEVAMWLMDHQMNMLISNEFGQYFVRLPLKKSANITHGNALRIDWNNVVSLENLNYIIGNPPFVGSKWMNPDQREDVKQFQTELPGVGILDYVAFWYIKAAYYIQKSKVKVAFVSTNSITQGEQVGTLWNPLFNKLQIKIIFAHRTFNWKNEAKGNAAVHVVIIGFAAYDIKPKYIFDYDHVSGESFITEVKNISPYLVEGPDFGIENRSRPLCDVATLRTGNKPIDGGHYIFSKDEMNEFIAKEPKSANYFKPFIGSEEFINGNPRYILWLKELEPSTLRDLPLVKERIERVIKFRSASSSAPTQKLASSPLNFHTECYPTSDFLIIPQVSSERRNYIPIGFEHPGIICSDKLRILIDASFYHFGILTSKMHMAWMRTVTGRLKSDYQYSVLTVYNNYPWPLSPTLKQVETIEKAAKSIISIRSKFKNSSLADLYDPITMPSELLSAHNNLDKAVDMAYRSQPFTSEAKRMEFLFELYEKYTADLFTKEKTKKSVKKAI
ncbi:Type II restriction/modification system, DNA methylase subunit YeeA [Daejeonella rubra]|uniref:site-specific DNA-methyltransferase (adenine-specific) n=1 Tax=Daejeonella rubra TaxID=990371 RepID=A0A1G9X3P9_9SPHI|nr:DNA methyltransferase [Daejeonella rubra]SDM91076.1 Type II restriction/modification system, DNA methylase subunit YeeA [Daejeonella rubra]